MVRYLDDTFKGEPSPDHQRAIFNDSKIISTTKTILTRFRSPEKAWQPSDRIPSISELKDDKEQLDDRVEAARGVPDALLVCLIGNSITEEALGNYTRELERTFPNTSENNDHPFHTFAKWWAAEERRHEVILDRYLQFTDANHKEVERAAMYLMQNGFDTGSGTSLYQGLVYPRFQEEATALSHTNLAQAAKQYDLHLTRLSGLVISDEKNHQRAYHALVETILELDPVGMTIALANMLDKGITMPAQLMNTEAEPDLYDKFAIIAARNGIYTGHDYAKILDDLITSLGITSLVYDGENADLAREAQDHLGKMGKKYHRLADLSARRLKKDPLQFKWIFDREA